MPCLSILEMERQEDQEFITVIIYVVNYRLAWAT